MGVCAEQGVALRLALTAELRALLEDAAIPKLLHDWKRRFTSSARRELQLRGAVEDTMLLSYALNPTHTTQTLADVAAQSRRGRSRVPAAAARSFTLSFPASALKRRNRRHANLSRRSIFPWLPFSSAWNRPACASTSPSLDGLSKRFSQETRTCRRAHLCASLASRFNINSPKQLGVVLFTHMGLPAPAGRGKGKTVSTAQDVLETLAVNHEVPRLVLEYRHLSKLKSNYIDALPLLADSDSRVHTTFQAAATATGRLSSVNPNLQNIPIRTELGREIRAAFTASPGTQLLSADYSQIELRLLAHFSLDPLLMRAYAEEIDIHTLTASEVFGVPIDSMDKETRGRAKAVNFGIVYGISAFGLAAQLGIPQAEARAYIERYFARYAGVKEFIDKTLEQTRREGAVRTLFGRLRPIPDIESRNPNSRGFAERTAVNTPLQGTAADLIKLAMIAIDRQLSERGLETRMLLQVHDELLFEVPLDETETIEKLVKEAMEGVVQLRVPLVADVAFGANWRDL